MKNALVLFALFSITPGLAAAKVPSEKTHAAIVSIVQARMDVPVLIVGPMAQEGSWIVTRWDTGDSGGKGEALLKRSGSAWWVVHSVRGTIDERYLESAGVPAASARALVNDMKKL